MECPVESGGTSAELDGGISTELDAYWIGKFNIRHLAAELAGVRHARHLRLQHLENRPDSVRLRACILTAQVNAEDDVHRQAALESSLKALRSSLDHVETRAKQMGRQREAEAMRRVDLAEAARVARDLDKQLAGRVELAEAAAVDAEAREQALQKNLSRAKEELRLREARHVQQVTSLAGAAERVRGEWETLRDENKRVLDAKRRDVAERRAALDRARLNWSGVKRELGTMIDQEEYLRTLLEKTSSELGRRNQSICSLLDAVVG